MNNFHPLKVVGRGSETRPQVGENLNTSTKVAGKLYYIMHTYKTLHRSICITLIDLSGWLLTGAEKLISARRDW